MANNNEQVKWEEFFEEGSAQTDMVPVVIVSGHQSKEKTHKRLEAVIRFYSDGRHKVVYLLKVKGWDVMEYYESRIALIAYNAA